MAAIRGQTIAAHVNPATPEEIAALAEQTWSPLPDLNFDILQDWLARGFQVSTVGWISRHGPAYGGPAVLFVVRHPDGRELATLVAPGKKVAEFIRQYAEEWQRNGVLFERIDFAE